MKTPQHQTALRTADSDHAEDTFVSNRRKLMSSGATAVTETATVERLLDLDAVCRFFGGTKPLHPCTIYRMIDAGRCPRPIRPSPNANRWLLSECKAALQAIVEVPREPLRSPKFHDRRTA
jgi:predicted DNA-binding transcriptional regulator AlpA